MKDDKTRAWTPEDRRVYVLFDYICASRLDGMRALLEGGADVNAVVHEDRSVAIAEREGHAEVAELLQAAGARWIHSSWPPARANTVV